MTRRYAALSLIPLAMLLLGLAALAAPEPLRGPLVAAEPLLSSVDASSELLGSLDLLRQPLYLADLVGLGLLALAVLEVWAIAISWEVRRHRR